MGRSVDGVTTSSISVPRTYRRSICLTCVPGLDGRSTDERMARKQTTLRLTPI